MLRTYIGTSTHLARWLSRAARPEEADQDLCETRSESTPVPNGCPRQVAMPWETFTRAPNIFHRTLLSPRGSLLSHSTIPAPYHSKKLRSLSLPGWMAQHAAGTRKR